MTTQDDVAAAKPAPPVQTIAGTAQEVAVIPKAQPPAPIAGTSEVATISETEAYFSQLDGQDTLAFNRFVGQHLLTTIAVAPEDKDRAQRAAEVALASFKPTDGVEVMLAAQATALHFAAMESLNRAANTQMFPHAMVLHKDAANLSRAMVDMLNALDRRRGKGGHQRIIVERVLIADGGNAIVGTVNAALPGGGTK